MSDSTPRGRRDGCLILIASSVVVVAVAVFLYRLISEITS